MAYVSADDYDSADEGLEMLLGGIALTDISFDAWTHQDEIVPAPSANPSKSAPNTFTRKSHGVFIDPNRFETLMDSSGFFVRAHSISGDGRVIGPSVQIVDLSSINDRGNALVATKFISRGSNIFTEKAAYVTQLPLQSDNVGKTNYWDSSPFAVRACQYCFRSLEPVSSCRANSSDLLPMPSLWPVPQYEQTAAEPGDSTFRRDKHGRLQCTECNSLFCSTNCRDKHEWQMTSCCQCINAMNTVLEILSPHVEKDAVIMASRIFCAMLTAYRKLPLEKIADEVEALCDLEGLCGNASDIEPLELGVISRSDAGQIQFSLLPVYNALCSNVYVMTAQERTDLSLELFSRLSAISGRNGFCVRTESPFRPYHSALLRAAGGRGSERHLAWMNEVAHALGSETLQRTMDREVEDLVCVQVVAIFSLTARMNHSCDPNAEVRSQQYVDCCIDVVAKRDIQPGEEITISYINNEGRTGSSLHDRNRRLRELKAKYLFTCDCHRCAIDQSRRSSNVPYA